MLLENIYSVLNSKLNTLTDAPTIFWEDVDNTLGASDTVLMPYMMPTDSTSDTMSGAGYEVDSGIYQVSIYTPKGKGWAASAKLATSIKELFARENRLVKDGESLVIRRVVIGQAQETDAHRVTPVSVYWRGVG